MKSPKQRKTFEFYDETPETLNEKLPFFIIFSSFIFHLCHKVWNFEDAVAYPDDAVDGTSSFLRIYIELPTTKNHLQFQWSRRTSETVNV